MTAFQIVPSGTTFAMKNERVIHSGTMGIGLAFTTEGDLIMADWDGGYPLDQKGAIWTRRRSHRQKQHRAPRNRQTHRAGFRCTGCWC
jgi:quinoprotein glucose dehydrogenase